MTIAVIQEAPTQVLVSLLVLNTLLSQRVRLCKVALPYDSFDASHEDHKSFMFLKAIAMNMTASERIISDKMFIVACGIKTDNHGDWEHVTKVECS